MEQENEFGRKLREIFEGLTHEDAKRLSDAFDAVFDAQTGRPIPCGRDACISLIELLSELTGMESDVFGTKEGFMNMYRVDLALNVFRNL